MGAYHEQVTISISIQVDKELVDIIKRLNEVGLPTSFSCAGFYDPNRPMAMVAAGYISFNNARAVTIFKSILGANDIYFWTHSDAPLAVYWYPKATNLVNSLQIPDVPFIITGGQNGKPVS